MYTVTFLSHPMHPRNAQRSRSGHCAHPASPEPAGSAPPAHANTLAGVFGRNLCSEPSAGQLRLPCVSSAVLQPETRARCWGWKWQRSLPVRDSRGWDSAVSPSPPRGRAPHCGQGQRRHRERHGHPQPYSPRSDGTRHRVCSRFLTCSWSGQNPMEVPAGHIYTPVAASTTLITTNTNKSAIHANR